MHVSTFYNPIVIYCKKTTYSFLRSTLRFNYEPYLVQSLHSVNDKPNVLKMVKDNLFASEITVDGQRVSDPKVLFQAMTSDTQIDDFMMVTSTTGIVKFVSSVFKTVNITGISTAAYLDRWPVSKL
jgi:hypothetical protein